MLLDLINRYRAKYGVNSSLSEEISRLLKKYELYEENIEYYQYTPREKDFFIQKQVNTSLVFPPGLSDNEYHNIAEKILGTDNEYLDKLYQISTESSSGIHSLLKSFLKSANKCKVKIIDKLSKLDNDEKSAVFTETFVKGIEHNLKKILEMCLFNENEETKEVGRLITSYLKNIGFYVPGSLENSIKSIYVSTPNSYTEQTNKKEMHGMIHFLRSLPYCLDYYNDDSEEIEHFCIEAICTYYKYEE